MKLPSKTNRKKWIWAGAGAAAALLIGLVYYSSSAVVVETVQPESGQVSLVLEETGYTESVSEYTLEAPKTSRVVAVYPDIGDSVGIGQDLLILDNLEADNLATGLRSEITSIKAQIIAIQEQVEPINAQIASSQAGMMAAQYDINGLQLQLDQAEDNYNRMEQLYTAGAVSQAEYEASEYELKTLQNQLESSEERLLSLSQTLEILNRQKGQVESDVGTMSHQLYTRQSDLSLLESDLIISSLSEGQVLEIPAEVGGVVQTGMPLIKIGGTGLLQVKADILSDDMAGIEIGQKVRISAPVLGGQVISGEVRQIYPSAFEKVSALGVIQRRVSIIISLDETAILKPGYEVTVSIETERRDNALRLARSAVRSNADGGYEVLKITNGRVEITPVKVGLKNQDWVEILEGLSSEEMVVKDAGLNLEQGSRVRISD